MKSIENQIQSLFLGDRRSPGIALLGLALLGLALAPSLACSSQKKAESPDNETVIPQETQRASEQRYGEQQMMMGDLNMTPAEQAGARHQRDAGRERDIQREERSKK